MKSRVTLIGAAVVAAAIALAFILAAVLTEGAREEARTERLLKRVEQLERQNAVQVREHRQANQADHDCIVALALLLADPARDRTVQPVPPSACDHRRE